MSPQVLERPRAKHPSNSAIKYIDIPKPYLLFLGEPKSKPDLKTAFGLRDWAPDACLGQYKITSDFGLGLEDMSPEDCAKSGAKSMIIGIAHGGGAIPESWVPHLVRAAKAGLDIVSGMHTRLADLPALKRAAKKSGVSLHDVRFFDHTLPIGTGIKRTGKRLLTVGTDVNIGKKYTSLAIAQEMQRVGMNADFRASGQTGILIAGSGIPLDAIKADFISGAAEAISPENDPDHWDVIEGQGSIVHPSYAGVTLALLHGCQPDYFVLCHDPSRTHIRGATHIPLPSIEQAADLYIRNGQATNPAIQFAGISLNTSNLTASQRDNVIGKYREETGLPVFDPMVDGAAQLVEYLQTLP